MQSGADSRTGRVLPLILVLAGFAVYANALSGPFVFDDRVAVVDNPNIRDFWSFSQALVLEPETSLSGRPVVNRTIALNYALHGLAVPGYHVMNVALHLLCGLALFGVVRRTLLAPALRDRFAADADLLAFLCALIWLVHPLQTEAVNYVTQRSEVMMGLFFLLTLYCAIRAAAGLHRAAWEAAAVLCCALGMGSKEVMATAPLVVLLHDRAYVSGSFAAALRGRWRLYAGLAATWLLLAAILRVATNYPAHNMGFYVGVTPIDYLLSQCPVLLDYLAHSLWPHLLVFDYGRYRPVTLAEAAPAGVVLIGLLIAALVAYWRYPTLGFLGLWLFIILSPSSSIVPIESEVGAERRMYVPVMAVVALLVAGSYALLARRQTQPGAPLRLAGRTRTLWLALCLFAAGGLACTTILRNPDYRDAVTLWRTAVRARPDNPRAHFMLANRLNERGDTDEGIAHLHVALQLKPVYPEAHANLATAHYRRGELEPAIEQYRAALEQAPDSPHVHYNLGVALRQAQRPREALAEFEAAVALEPDLQPALVEIAWLLVAAPDPSLRDADRAVRVAQHAAALPGGPDVATLEVLAAAYASGGRFTDAVATARRALDLAGGDPRAARIRGDLRRYEQQRPHGRAAAPGGDAG